MHSRTLPNEHMVCEAMLLIEMLGSIPICSPHSVFPSVCCQLGGETLEILHKSRWIYVGVTHEIIALICIRHSAYGHSAFGIRAFGIQAFGIRHSAFGIRHSAYGHSAFGIRAFGIRHTGIRQSGRESADTGNRCGKALILLCIPARAYIARLGAVIGYRLSVSG